MVKINIYNNVVVRYLFFGLFIFAVSLSSKGQEIKVRGGFFSDSVGIGQQTKYYLTATYPSKLNVIFPDSTYTFTPFEFEGKKYFPTQSSRGVSYDSVIYALSTFEVDSVQTLALPVFVVSEKDSVEFTGNLDTIVLSQLVQSVPDTISADKLPLKMNTAYQRVFFLFNYPIWMISIGVFVMLAAIVFFIFGKRIRKYIRIKRLKKNHAKFLETYTTQIDQVKSTFSPVVTESTLATWKKYMEQLESTPFTKLTTREILQLEKDEFLGNNLKGVDKAIYGHPYSVVEPLERLRDYAGNKFLKKLDEISHG
jgi:hypothetical protein